MAQAVTQLVPGAKYSIGPAITDGFYYDFELPGGKTFTEDDLTSVGARMREIITSDQPFTRSEMSIDEALALFADQPYKCEIIERVRALADAPLDPNDDEASEDAVFSVGPYSFRPGSKMLTGANARKVRLTEKETAILRFLYRAGQMAVSRETLLQEVWGYNSGVTTHTLETHIYRLRQKIEKDAANPEILVTEAGGYKLVP